MARKCTSDAITPFAAEWDEKGHFPRDVIKQAAELGFAAIYANEESGGIGLGRLEAALIMEAMRSEEHTSELQSLMRISYAVFCLKKKKHNLQRQYCTLHTQNTSIQHNNTSRHHRIQDI